MVRLEGLDKWKNVNYLIENQTHYLLACSIAPQSSKLPRAPAEEFPVLCTVFAVYTTSYTLYMAQILRIL
jgi:hypothetical protein